MLVDGPGTEIKVEPAQRGLVELIIKLGRNGTYRSLFLTPEQVNSLIVALSSAKRERI